MRSIRSGTIYTLPLWNQCGMDGWVDGWVGRWVNGWITFEVIKMPACFIPALPSMCSLRHLFCWGGKKRKEKKNIASYIHSLEIYNSLKHIKGSENSCIRNRFERNWSKKIDLSLLNWVFFKKRLMLNLSESPLGKDLWRI